MKKPHPLKLRWDVLAAREKNMLLIAATVVGVALVWWLALAPALQTLRASAQRHAQLDAQLQHMQRLQAEAVQLQSAQRAAPGNASELLRAALMERLGSTAQIQMTDSRATVTLQQAPADALAQWLSQARSNARATPSEARLIRVAANSNAEPAATADTSDAKNATPRWDGSLVFTLQAAR